MPHYLLRLASISVLAAAGCTPSPGPSALPETPGAAHEKQLTVDAGGRTYFPGAPRRPAPVLAAEPPALPAGAPLVWSLTSSGSWVVEGWEAASPARLRPVADKGGKALFLAIQGAWQYNAAISLQTGGILPEKGNAVLFVYNAGKDPVNVAFAVWTSDKYEYFESRTQVVTPATWSSDKAEPFVSPTLVVLPDGWHKLAFSLDGKNYKSAPDWKFTNAIRNREDLRKISIIVYNDHKDALLFLGGLTVPTVTAPKPAPKAEPPTPVSGKDR